MDERKEVEEKALTVVEEANALVIRDNAGYESAGAFLLRIKSTRKELIGKIFDKTIALAHSAHKEAVLQKKTAELPWIKAEGTVKLLMADYAADQEKIRQEKEDALRREAEAKEEEERLARAAEAEKAGAGEEAEAILNEPAEVQTVVVAKTTPKLAGVSFKKSWKFQVVNEALVPRQFLCVNTVALGAHVRGLKEKAKVAGVRIYSEDSVAAGVR